MYSKNDTKCNVCLQTESVFSSDWTVSCAKKLWALCLQVSSSVSVWCIQPTFDGFLFLCAISVNGPSASWALQSALYWDLLQFDSLTQKQTLADFMDLIKMSLQKFLWSVCLNIKNIVVCGLKTERKYGSYKNHTKHNNSIVGSMFKPNIVLT